MKDTRYYFYRFIFNDGAFYDITCAASFKDAIWELSKYFGFSSEMFRECLKWYDDAEITTLIELYNDFASIPIGEIYVVEKAIYPDKESDKR